MVHHRQGRAVGKKRRRQEITNLRRTVNNMADARKMAVFVGGCHSSFFLLVVAVIHFLPCHAEGGITLSKTCGEVACQIHEFCSEYDRRCTKCESVCEKDSHNFQEDICHKDCQDYLHDMRYVRNGGEASTENVEDLRNSVQRLTQLVSVSLAISVLLLLILVAFVFLVWRRSRRATVADGGESAVRGQDDSDVASYLHAKVANKKNPFKSDKTPVAVISNPSNGLKLDISATGPGVAQQQSNSRQRPQPQAPLPPERTSASTICTAGGRSEATEAYSPQTTTSTPLSHRPPRYPSEDTTLDYAYDNRALTPSPRLEKDHPPTPYHHPQQMGIKGETTF